jgi:hypothetical protein
VYLIFKRGECLSILRHGTTSFNSFSLFSISYDAVIMGVQDIYSIFLKSKSAPHPVDDTETAGTKLIYASEIVIGAFI